MTETAKPKPLWWRLGEGKWHEEPPAPIGDEFWHNLIIRGQAQPQGYCSDNPDLGDRGYETRRYSAPPVADQCRRCRAAKAKQRKVNAK